MQKRLYSHNYNESYALIIGINDYQYVNPLCYASNDAEGIKKLLIDKFGFKSENVVLLLDRDATRSRIMKEYLSFVNKTNTDDRIIFFFAGHGFTYSGKRNEIGYLVPFDGDTNDLSSMIRWDDLTKNSELIPAKHIFYIIDACFSGLAITRSVRPGHMRYLKDMMTRYSRQVLTAGKANQTVADSNGPIPGHSIFTGHLLVALKEGLKKESRILTANNVMSYVQEKVGTDIYSQQTPHYGYIDGDGDFIFCDEILKQIECENGIDRDILIEVRHEQNISNDFNEDLIDSIKEYISDDKYRIKLDSIINIELKQFLYKTGKDNIPLNGNVNTEAIVERLLKYDEAVKNILMIGVLLSHWGGEILQSLIVKLLKRSTDNINIESGNTIWLKLRWYPIMMLVYSMGISAVASKNFRSLGSIFSTNIQSIKTYSENKNLIVSVISEVLDLTRYNVFKNLPGHEKYYIPRSEYIFKRLQPTLDDLLFVGKSYEEYFDTFELLYALHYADYNHTQNENVWGPPGRFGWKYKSRRINPFTKLLKEADKYREDWWVLKSGMFNGSFERFKNISNQYEENILKKLGWF